MRHLRTIAVAAVVTLAPPAFAQQERVTVYLTNINVTDIAVLAKAKKVAADILHPAEVDLLWKFGGLPRTVDAETLQIEFLEDAPPRFAANAMAYATPYRQGGTCIHVFYHRVEHICSRQITPALLGHVMAHEITHVLQGIACHSVSGVMKASWDSADYDIMAVGSLPFTAEDIHLIRDHWVSRITRGPASSNPVSRQ
jgi:hypothetical protein